MFYCTALPKLELFFTAAASHLQGVWMSKVGRSSDPHGDPDVNHLSCYVTQRQVAHHRLLSLSGVCEMHMFAGGEGGPCNLSRKEMVNAAFQGYLNSFIQVRSSCAHLSTAKYLHM